MGLCRWAQPGAQVYQIHTVRYREFTLCLLFTLLDTVSQWEIVVLYCEYSPPWRLWLNPLIKNQQLSRLLLTAQDLRTDSPFPPHSCSLEVSMFPELRNALLAGADLHLAAVRCLPTTRRTLVWQVHTQVQVHFSPALCLAAKHWIHTISLKGLFYLCSRIPKADHSTGLKPF